MSKSFAPFFYALALFPIFFVLVAVLLVWEAYARFSFGLNGLFESALVILLPGSFILGWFNISVIRWEKLNKPILLDHLRHCALYYFFAGAVMVNFLLQGIGNALIDAYLVMVLAICLWAVIINALILIAKSHTPRRNSQ